VNDEAAKLDTKFYWVSQIGMIAGYTVLGILVLILGVLLNSGPDALARFVGAAEIGVRNAWACVTPLDIYPYPIIAKPALFTAGFGPLLWAYRAARYSVFEHRLGRTLFYLWSTIIASIVLLGLMPMPNIVAGCLFNGSELPFWPLKAYASYVLLGAGSFVVFRMCMALPKTFLRREMDLLYSPITFVLQLIFRRK
jgi:hypothetical protein